ncbi:GNAT family N-acetyltransferase [Dictyobacter formicarum]|uniref:N-acetyltransferase domain-containing protein n=1 Tax=Dictyobacter formicarum TaxID=2778368 RepID=A0ABQ3V7N3_9CHLR|nr:GNAT family N-acetyltransferase [Dictyobacter formicarum]GHO82130.1 hypothetical protein KSZ_01360 [Dictyobacter formicarum]
MSITLDIAAADYTRDLGDGLIAHWSTAADTEKIAQAAGQVFRGKESDPFNDRLANAVRVYMSGRIPIMGPDDYAIVEDRNKEGNPVVAGICLQRMEWYYDDIPFKMSRPEIVFSHPDYRNRGLVRTLFEFVHARSAAEGRLLDGITGIYYFYRQFGYEYALDLDSGKGVYLTSIPKAKEGEVELYTLREATETDLPQMQAIYAQRDRSSHAVSTLVDQDYMQWLVEDWHDHPARAEFPSTQIIVDAQGQVQGWLSVPMQRRGRSLNVWSMYTRPHLNLQAMLSSLLRALQSYGQQIPAYKPDTEAFSEIKFYLGQQHPVYEALGSVATITEPGYAWYIRIADLPRFIRHIAPALEKRLLNSPVEGFTGELKLDFYRGGLRLAFKEGRLETVEDWRSTVMNYSADGGFPPLAFFKALLGYRSLAELRQSYPDAWVNNEVLFNTLFPAKPSWAIVL